jgi:uncharacterized protein YkwD
MSERIVYEDERVVVLVREKVPAPAVPTPPAESSPLYGLVNGARAGAGLDLLFIDTEAERIAQSWAEEMARSGDFRHNPNVAGHLSAPWFSYGENIAWGYDSEAAVHRAWMDSPGHRRNIENPAFTALGVGLAHNGQGRPYWVEVFVDRTP